MPFSVAAPLLPTVCVFRGLTRLHAYPRGQTAHQNASASRTIVLQTTQRFAAEAVVVIASEEELLRCLNS